MTPGPVPPPQTFEEPAPEPRRGQANTLRASFGYAFAGLGYCLRTQRNFRIHVAIGAAATVLGLLLGLTWVEWAVLAVTMVLVLVAEMVNTMIESLVDLVTQEYHPLAKTAKDVAADLSARETSHITYFELAFVGRTDAAIDALYAHLTEWPRDALVLATAANPNGLIGASGRIGQKPCRLTAEHRNGPGIPGKGISDGGQLGIRDP